MAQTGYTPLLIYSSSTGGNAPAAGNLTNSTLGSELAINITDGKLFYKDNANAVQVIGWKTTPTTAGGTGLTSYTAGDLLYYATGTTFSKLAIGTNGQILKSTGSAPAWENVSALAVTSISFGTTGLTPSTATQGAVTVAGTLVAANGGTGQSSYTVGDILYASGSTTLSKLADVATGNALISGGVGVAPSWGKIGLTTHVSGILPVANGGTGTSTAFTAGSVVFADTSGVYGQDNATFFWDNTNKRLGINTATPGYPLDVSYGGGNIARFINTSGRGYVRFDGKADFTHQYYVNGAAVGFVQTDSGGNEFMIGSYGAYPLEFWTNSTEKMRLFSSGGLSLGNTTDPGAGNLYVNGTIKTGTTIGVGAATPATSGAGITFPAAQSASSNANTLDDYEEGTFTPTAVSGVSMYGPQGWYTKIGNSVYCYGSINTTAITGNITLGGLPFTSANTYTQCLGRGAFQIVTATDVTIAQNGTQVQINVTGTQSSGAFTQLFAFQYQTA